MPTTTSTPATETADREIVTVRVFTAPRDRVFRTWIDPEHLSAWWGPNGFTTTTQAMDVRPGGRWRFIMHGPDGVDYLNLIEYEEVVRPGRLVYAHSGGEEGDDTRFRTIVTFAEQDGRTTLTMRGIFATAEGCQRVIREYGAVEGGEQTLARLADCLERRP